MISRSLLVHQATVSCAPADHQVWALNASSKQMLFLAASSKYYVKTKSGLLPADAPEHNAANPSSHIPGHWDPAEEANDIIYQSAFMYVAERTIIIDDGIML